MIPYMLKIVERKREFAPDQLKSEQYRNLEAKRLKARAVVSARGEISRSNDSGNLVVALSAASAVRYSP